MSLSSDYGHLNHLQCDLHCYNILDTKSCEWTIKAKQIQQRNASGENWAALLSNMNAWVLILTGSLQPIVCPTYYITLSNPLHPTKKLGERNRYWPINNCCVLSILDTQKEGWLWYNYCRKCKYGLPEGSLPAKTCNYAICDVRRPMVCLIISARLDVDNEN